MREFGIDGMDKKTLRALPAYERLMLVAEPYKPCGGIWVPPSDQRKVYTYGWFMGDSSEDYYCRILDQSKERVVPATHVVWEHHNGPIPAGKIICHHCDNPPCIEISHLFMGSMADNSRDMAQKRRQKHKPFPRGERHPNSRLTEKEVLEIYTDDRPRMVIARDYGVGHDAVRYIQEGINWTHITKEEPIEEGKYGALSESQVKELYCDPRTYQELSKAYGISRVAVFRIKTGRSWSEVTRGLKRG